MKDVNGTGYHLVYGGGDWRRLLADAAGSGLRYDDLHVALGLDPLPYRFPEQADARPLTADRRRGAAADRFGNWYWLADDELEIRWRPPAATVASRYWRVDDLRSGGGRSGDAGAFVAVDPPAAPAAPRLRGLAVTASHYLVVGTREPDGLLVFDLHAGGPPAGWRRWTTVPFAPLDLAATPDGGLWVLDAPAGGEARLWRLDRHFRVLEAAGLAAAPAPAAFAPFAGEPCPPPPGPETVPLSASLALDTGVAEAVSVAGLPDDSVLVLATGDGPSVVHRFRDGAAAGVVDLTGALPWDLVAHDMAFTAGQAPLPGVVAGSLVLAARDGNQSHAFTLRTDGELFELVLQPRYLPMRRFGGRALVASAGEVHYDIAERWVPLAEQPRQHFPRQATLGGLVIDGGRPGTVWHRVVVDACIPDGTAVSIRSRSADERQDLAAAAWQTESPPYRRADGSELPHHRPYTADEADRDGVGTWELLLQDRRGRFAELELTLRSRGRRTPRIRALRVHHPRFSYAERYLPAVYRDDPVSGSFVDRFLANPEGLLTTLEGRIASFERMLDARTAPVDYLAWLAGWLGAAVDDAWDEARLRLFVAHAATLFRWRGTPGGLVAAIRLATDDCVDASLFDALGVRACGASGFGVRIVEQFLRRRASGVALGDPSRLEQPGFTTAAFEADCEGTVAGATAPPSWDPSQGAEPLHARYQEFLAGVHGGGDPGDRVAVLARLNEAWGTGYLSLDHVTLSPVQPGDPRRAVDWETFVATELGFTYEVVTGDDAAAWREFLTQRYGTVGALNRAHGLAGDRAHASLAAVDLPAEDDFPRSGARLVDWIDFVSRLVPLRRNAHRMTVLVPTTPDESAAARAARLARVEDVVRRERPAHVGFEVKPFWALFQVGGVRVGLETIVGESSRYTALVLGGGHVGEHHLAASHPWDVLDRRIVGRDAVTRDWMS